MFQRIHVLQGDPDSTVAYMARLQPEYNFTYNINYTMKEKGAALPPLYPTQLNFRMIFPSTECFFPFFSIFLKF